MRIRLTATASREIAKLADDEQHRVLSVIRDELPLSVATDQTLNVEAIGGEVRVHRLGDDGFVAFYRTTEEGDEATATVLTVFDQRDLESTEQMFGAVKGFAPETRDAQIGFEVLTQLQQG